MLFERKRVTQKVVHALPGATKPLIKKKPPHLIKLLLQRGLDLAFRNRQMRKELDFIQGRCILVRVVDLDLGFSVGLKHERFAVTFPCDTADVVVSADFGDFMSLIGGVEDPDTLFFRRRLKITGDTELGLRLKNFLDRIETKDIFPGFVHRAVVQFAHAHSAQARNSEDLTRR